MEKKKASFPGEAGTSSNRFDGYSMANNFRKRRNPSYPIAPHCTLLPRNCYCMRKDGLMICPVKAFSDSCFENLIALVIKKDVKEKKPEHYFTERKKVVEYERLTDKEVFERASKMEREHGY